MNGSSCGADVPGGDDQLTAEGRRAAVLRLLLNGARLHSARHGDREERVAPSANGRGYAADRDSSRRSPKAKVALYELLVVRNCCSTGPAYALLGTIWSPNEWIVSV